jgi:hypothetical protein
VTSQKTLEKIGKELEELATNHGVCIAAVVTFGEGEGLTVMVTPLASPPLALEDHAARFVAEHALVAYQSLAREREAGAPGSPLTRGWLKR